MDLVNETESPVNTNSNEELKDSVRQGNFPKVLQLLKYKRLKNTLGQTLLYLAIKNGRVSIAELLLKRGCKIQNDVPHNELVVAMWQDDLMMLDMLLRNGGDFRVFTYMPESTLRNFGDFAKLILAIKTGKVTDVEILMRKLTLTTRLLCEFHKFAEFYKRPEIANALKVKIGELMENETEKC